MIPPKYYLKNRIEFKEKNQKLTDISRKIIQNANINAPFSAKLNLRDEIVNGGIEKFRALKNSEIRLANSLNPNEQGYVRPEFGKLRLRNPVSRVTGHLRYNGEIVRPHLRRNPNI